jgi:hypothetical protein
MYGGQAHSQINDPITNNNLPNPYRTLRDWAELPQGMTWPAITGVMEGPDGNLYVLGRCHENSCAGRTEPAVLVYNSSGRLVNSWGSGLFNFPHGFMAGQAGKRVDQRCSNRRWQREPGFQVYQGR